MKTNETERIDLIIILIPILFLIMTLIEIYVRSVKN